MAAAQGEIQSLHRYKLQPPYFTGDYATFEEWKHKRVAYLGLQNSEFPRLLQTAEAADIAVTDELLVEGASNMEEARLWVQLSKDLHYILVSVCSGQAAVICRQHSTQAQGLETWRQLHARFSIPIGTRRVGYLTKLLNHNSTNRSSKRASLHGSSRLPGTKGTIRLPYPTTSR